MKPEILLGLCTFPVIAITGGILSARFWAKKREQGTIAKRLARWVSSSSVNTNSVTLLKKQESASTKPNQRFSFEIPQSEAINSLLIGSQFEGRLSSLLTLSLCLFLVPLIMASVFDFNIAYAFVPGLIFAIIPFIILKINAESQRTKFCGQLPDAIDLMVAVLRSGHSVSQAVKAISQDLPNPCGSEFEIILRRINLGQPLSDSLVLSAKRFASYELDLMRRAVSIQAEVGGSLAELLDKTNSTLRERLKLARQLKVVTAQSRLSALIVGLLPIALAVALNFLSPGYLQLLTQDSLGQSLLMGAIVLELFGIFIMHRMSTMRI
jgi:tight adherence protein B